MFKKLFGARTPKRVPARIIDPKCPYCGMIQNPPPTRKRKCRDCGATIRLLQIGGNKKRLITEGDFEHRERERRNRQWQELSQQIENSLNTGAMQTASVAYFGQAHMSFAEGREFRHALREAHRCNLLNMQSVGIMKVKVLTCQDERVCPTCKALEGKVLGVRQALNQMPIPGEDCQDRKSKNSHGGMCRCIFVAQN